MKFFILYPIVLYKLSTFIFVNNLFLHINISMVQIDFLSLRDMDIFRLHLENWKDLGRGNYFILVISIVLIIFGMIYDLPLSNGRSLYMDTLINKFPLFIGIILIISIIATEPAHKYSLNGICSNTPDCPKCPTETSCVCDNGSVSPDATVGDNDGRCNPGNALFGGECLPCGDNTFQDRFDQNGCKVCKYNLVSNEFRTGCECKPTMILDENARKCICKDSNAIYDVDKNDCFCKAGYLSLDDGSCILPWEKFSVNLDVTTSTWSEPHNYSTIRSVVVGTFIYIVFKNNADIVIMKYDTTNDTFVTKFVYDNFSRNARLDQPLVYSTITVDVMDSNIYIMMNEDSVILNLTFDTHEETFSIKKIVSGFSIIDDESVYTSIRTKVVDKHIYRFTRMIDGLILHVYDSYSDRWTSTAPPGGWMRNQYGWGDKEQYSTIKVVEVNKILYIIGRSTQNIVIYSYDTINQKWSDECLNCDETDENSFLNSPNNRGVKWNKNWDEAHNWITLRTVVHGKNIFFLIKGDEKLFVYCFSTVTKKWIFTQYLSDDNANDDGHFIPLVKRDDLDLTHSQYYSTMKAIVVGNTIKVFIRSKNGIKYYVFDVITKKWAAKDNVREFHDGNIWDNIAHYSTIRTNHIGDKTYILGKDTNVFSIVKCNY